MNITLIIIIIINIQLISVLLCYSGIIELISQTNQAPGFDNIHENTYYDSNSSSDIID